MYIERNAGEAGLRQATMDVQMTAEPKRFIEMSIRQRARYFLVIP